MSAVHVEFPRIHEFLEGIVKTNPRRAYFQDFETSIAKNPIKRNHFTQIESDLSGLDEAAWIHLKSTVASKFKLKHPTRGWQSAFDTLNEAKAYNYLVKLGCADVSFLPVSLKKTPDLQARLGTTMVLCEVKTINATDVEANARQQMKVRDVQSFLPDHFLKKLAQRLTKAEIQIASFCKDDDARRITYVILNFDDSFNEYVAKYIEQIRAFALGLAPSNMEIVFDVKPAFYSATTQSRSAELFVCTQDRIWRAL